MRRDWRLETGEEDRRKRRTFTHSRSSGKYAVRGRGETGEAKADEEVGETKRVKERARGVDRKARESVVALSTLCRHAKLYGG
jgi:hypothetical protein